MRPASYVYIQQKFKKLFFGEVETTMIGERLWIVSTCQE